MHEETHNIESSALPFGNLKEEGYLTFQFENHNPTGDGALPKVRFLAEYVDFLLLTTK